MDRRADMSLDGVEDLAGLRSQAAPCGVVQAVHRPDVHLIVDNYGTHKTEPVRKRLLDHPRFQLHFTPTGSSWLNLWWSAS